MPKAKKLPSGSWRCRASWMEMVNGKKVQRSKSFTADTRKDAELAAAMYERGKKEEAKSGMTVGEAMDAFIEARKDSLSPSTLRSYKSSRKSAFKLLEAVSLSEIDNLAVQRWVDDFKVERSAKTVANNYMLLQSTITMFRPSLHLRVILPQRKQAELLTPTDADVKKLLEIFKGTEMEKAILLAAFGTLRRSEICALTRADVTGDTVSVNKAMVYDGSGWVLKSPKTVSSVRSVQLPKKVIRKLLKGLKNPADRIVDMNPNQLSLKFFKEVRSAGLPQFRFHDLRAYAASMRHALGIPDQYIMMDGGWKTDGVLKRVYRRALEDKRKEFAKISNDHFTSLLK